MRVLLASDISGQNVSGVNVSIQNLTRGLRERGHEVRILMLSDDHHSHIEGDVYMLPSVSLSFIYPTIRQPFLPNLKPIIRELCAWSPDIVHTNSEFVVYMRSAIISRICHAPLVHTYHTMWGEPEYLKYLRGIVTPETYIAYLRLQMRRAAAIITPTEKTRACLEGYKIKKPMHVIPSGINLSRLTAPADAGRLQALREKYRISPGERVIVYVGRIGKEKNIEEIVRYTQRLNEKDSRYRMLIVGDGPYLVELKKTVEGMNLKEGLCYFTGMVPNTDIGLYYRLGDVFCTASTTETQGITYIESMACGTPVVCRRDAAVDGLIENGRTGYAYTDFDEFAQYVELLYNDGEHRAKIIEQARERAGGYTVEAFAEKVEHVYYSVINA